MNTINPSESREIFEKIKKGDERAFEVLFSTYYKSLCNYAFRLLDENEGAEEVAQDIFVKLWEKRSTIDIETSLNNYLFRSVKNHCLNIIQHNKIKNQYSERVKDFAKQNHDYSQYFIEPGLAAKIETSIHSMPEKRKEIFRLSREDGLKYKEIADRLNISIKTVEAQMGLALKYLRENLKEFDPNVALFFIFYRADKGI